MTGLRPRSPATELNTQRVPPPRASRRRRASSQKTTVLAKSTVRSRRQSSGSVSSASCPAKSPAVTTTQSSPPSVASAAASAGANSVGRSRSQGAHPIAPAGLPASASRSRALRASSSASRPSRKRSAPRAASCRASARPIPFVAPRTTAFIPADLYHRRASARRDLPLRRGTDGRQVAAAELLDQRGAPESEQLGRFLLVAVRLLEGRPDVGVLQFAQQNRKVDRQGHDRRRRGRLRRQFCGVFYRVFGQRGPGCVPRPITRGHAPFIDDSGPHL